MRREIKVFCGVGSRWQIAEVSYDMFFKLSIRGKSDQTQQAGNWKAWHGAIRIDAASRFGVPGSDCFKHELFRVAFGG